MVSFGSILLADDETTFSEATAELLRAEGYACCCANDGDQAISLLKEQRFDLLISDIRMPGNDDLRLVRESQKLCPGLPVILATGFPSVESAIDAIDLPVTAYLKKPIDLKTLLSHVRSALQQSAVVRGFQELQEHLEHVVEEVKAITTTRQLSQQLTIVGSPPFPTATLRNLAGCLTEMIKLNRMVAPDSEQPMLCRLADCSHYSQQTKALTETVRVLNETRGKFKSKELGDLRRKLELFLENP